MFQWHSHIVPRVKSVKIVFVFYLQQTSAAAAVKLMNDEHNITYHAWIAKQKNLIKNRFVNCLCSMCSLSGEKILFQFESRHAASQEQ